MSEEAKESGKLELVGRVAKENGNEKNGGPRARPRDRGAVVPDLDAQADKIFVEGMTAHELKWNNGTQSFDEYPDTKTRLDALKLYMAYKHGLPVQRIVRIETGFKDRNTELVQMASTPSGRDLLLKAGIITEEWIAKNVPAKSQQGRDSQKRELS